MPEDDAISGAEAQVAWFMTTPLSVNSVLNYNATTRMFADYVPGEALVRINGFLLNFDATDLHGNKINDGQDNIFGDEGNDWIVGGTQSDRMMGGMGDDLLNGDDNLETSNGINNAVDPAPYADADWAFGGGGFDVLIANTGADRLIDWVKRFNTYAVPIKPSVNSPGPTSPTILREPTQQIVDLLVAMQFSSGGDGAVDVNADRFYGDIGLITIEDGPDWTSQVQLSSDRDPAPSNILTALDTFGTYEQVAPAGFVARATSESSIAIEGGKTAAISVWLTSPPTSNVVMNLSNSDSTEVQLGTTSLTFTPENWAIPQFVVLNAVDDSLLDGDKQAVVTVAVNTGLSDSAYTAVSSQTVTITAEDNELVFDRTADVRLLEDNQTQITLTGISTGSRSNVPVRFTVSSTNSILLPGLNVNYTPGASSATLAIVPAAELSGTATVTVTMEDGGPDNNLATTADNNVRIRNFVVEVKPVNDAPTLNSLSNLTIREDAPLQTVSLAGITAGGGESQPLRITVVSSNPAVIPAPTVNYTSAAATGTIQFKPAALKSGTVTLTVQVEDGGLDGNLSTTADNGITLRTFTVLVDAVRSTITGPLNSISNPRPVITWTAVSDAVAYDIWIQNVTTGQNPMVLTTVTTNSYQHPTDLGIGRFNVWVRAVKVNNSRYPWSISSQFVINTAASINSMNRRQYTSRPTVSWAPVSGAVRYDLWIDNLTTGQRQYVRDVSITSTSWTADVDMPLSAYRVWVRAFNASGGVALCSGGVDFQVAVYPTLLTPTAATFDRTPTFQWTSVSGAQSYELLMRNIQTGATVAQVSGLTSPTWTAPTDLPDGNYRWWTAAIGANGFRGDWSYSSDVNVGGRAQLLSPTTTTSATNTLFTWTSVGMAATYELWVDRVDVSQNKVIHQTGLTSTSFTSSTNLVSGGTYRAWVRAVSTTGEVGLWSAMVTFTVAVMDDLQDDESNQQDNSQWLRLDEALPTKLLASWRTHINNRPAEPTSQTSEEDHILQAIAALQSRISEFTATSSNQVEATPDVGMRYQPGANAQTKQSDAPINPDDMIDDIVNDMLFGEWTP